MDFIHFTPSPYNMQANSNKPFQIFYLCVPQASYNLYPTVCVLFGTYSTYKSCQIWNLRVAYVQYAHGLSEQLPFSPPTKGRLKPIFRRPLATLPNKNSRCTSPNVARISKLPMFQKLLGS